MLSNRFAAGLPLARGLVVSLVLHAGVFALAFVHAAGLARITTVFYEVDVEPEPPRSVFRPDEAEPREEALDENADGPETNEAAREQSTPSPNLRAAPSREANESRVRGAPGAATGLVRPAGTPAAAQAGTVLTAPDSAGESGLADFTMVQGAAKRYAGGYTSAQGTSQRSVRDPRARGGVARGVATPAPKATGTVTRPLPPALAPSRRRPARPLRLAWDCPFPPEADALGLNFARARVVVTVGVDGKSRAVSVISDPGHGFGAAARSCALAQAYEPALDDQGRTTTGSTPPITVTFRR